MNSILDELDWRGLLFQVNDRPGLNEHLKAGMVTLYQGFDPTADSLHIGNLLGLLVLKRFQAFGHQPIIVVGGGTGLIGDPSGRASERELNTENVVAEWSGKIRQQTGRFVDFETKESNRALLVNNYEWLSKLGALDFLRNVGKHFTVNEMLGKESVSLRLESGISYTEFSYMLLQSYDFFELNKRYNCTLQIGGSDQWGNIAAGASYIRKAAQSNVFVLTIPLVTTAEGKKFGKSEGNAVWLDAKKTSPYHFYQFWLNTNDADVIKLMKFYTFLNQADILDFASKLKESPEKREAQRALAAAVTSIVHGKSGLEEAERITGLLFSNDISSLSKDEVLALSRAGKEVPILNSYGKLETLIDYLLKAGVVSSKRQAREDADHGALTLNGKPLKDISRNVLEDDFLFGIAMIVRRGKKDFYHIKPLRDQ